MTTINTLLIHIKTNQKTLSANKRPLSQNQSQNIYSQFDGNSRQIKKENFISRKIYQSTPKKT